MTLAAVERSEGRLGQADRRLDRIRSAGLASASELALLAQEYASVGRGGEDRGLVRELESLDGRQWVSPYDVAKVHAILGDGTRALDLLEKGRDARAEGMTLLAVDGVWRPIRSHPRFQRLLRDLRLTGT